MTTETDSVEGDQRRAEVFDALSHPTRILILKALSQEPLGFADLKKKLGIESSGHLQHHLNKLCGLAKTDEYGKYVLSDEGKDALLTVNIVEKTAKTESSLSRKVRHPKTDSVFKTAILALILALSFSLVLAAVDVASLSNQASSFKSNLRDKDQEIAQLNDAAAQRETAFCISRAVLTVKKPPAAPLLSMVEGEQTKIVLLSTRMGYFYGPNPLPAIEWPPGHPLLIDKVNGAILQSNGGLTYPDDNYTLRSNNMDNLTTYVIISIKIQNSYSQADYANTTESTSPETMLRDHNLKQLSLTVKLYALDDSLIRADFPNLDLNQTWTNTNSKNFTMGYGEVEEVMFYLIPASFDFDHYEIYVSSLRPIP